jgi:hypothetical protein
VTSISNSDRVTMRPIPSVEDTPRARNGSAQHKYHGWNVCPNTIATTKLMPSRAKQVGDAQPT